MKNHAQISRRSLMKSALISPVIAGQSGRTQARSDFNKPNILLLMTDQHRGDCLGIDGHPVIRTPNLDALAKDGVHFRNAYSTTPTCTPARAALLTGMSPWNHGMLGYSKVAEQYPVEMPRVLRDAGYYTLGIGKMHFAPQRNLHGYHQTLLDESGRIQSIDFRSDYRSWFYSKEPNLDPDATGIGWNDYDAKPYVLPEELHPTRWTGDTAVHFLKTYDKPQPFFLKVSFARPHSPYDAPQRFWNLYKNAPIPEAFIGDWAERHAQRGKQLPKNTWRGDLGKDQVRKSRQGYYGSISFIDEQVGRILDVLTQRNLLESTLVLLIADHGDMMGDHYLWRKSYAYEGSARIPMLMRWPKGLISARQGQVLQQPVEIRDVLPTFIDAASTSVAQQLDGRSLLALADGKAPDWRTFIDLEHDVCYSAENHWNALTDGAMKYIFHAQKGEEQLFDLIRDPGEETDLASKSEHQAALKRWRQRMVEHLAIRGEEFVKDGKLVPRPKRRLLSPNYPKKSS